MFRSLKITLQYAAAQLKRSLRDPITTIVLFGIPVILVLIFGSLTRNSDNISMRVAILNNSDTPFSRQFEKSLKDVKSLELPDTQLSMSEAREQVKNDSLDGIIELPDDFGETQNGVPTGKVKVYVDESNAASGDILTTILQSVVGHTNEQLAKTAVTPLTVERTSLSLIKVSAFDNIYAIFTAMAIMMVGVFAVGSVFPTDKKSGALRRLHVTPIRSREIILGTMLTYTVIGLIGVGLLTLIAVALYGLDMRGDWFTYGIFVLVSVATMLGFGLAIGGVSKNSTQSDILGQIVFIASLSVSGVWFPRTLLPEWMQGITAFFPLTPVIEGIRAIVAEGATLVTLLPEIGILLGWAVLVYSIGIRVFKWS